MAVGLHLRILIVWQVVVAELHLQIRIVLVVAVGAARQNPGDLQGPGTHNVVEPTADRQTLGWNECRNFCTWELFMIVNDK